MTRSGWVVLGAIAIAGYAGSLLMQAAVETWQHVVPSLGEAKPLDVSGVTCEPPSTIRLPAGLFTEVDLMSLMRHCGFDEHHGYTIRGANDHTGILQMAVPAQH